MIMKKQFLFATLALATMFTACSKEEELSKNEGGTPVNFVIGGVGSRTVTSDGYVATFEEGDKVGIISADTDPAIANAEFIVSGNALNNSNTYNLVKEQAATFYAYYPHVESATSNNVIYTVASDQSDADKFNANDFMTATASLDANDENGTVSFNFDHQLAFVEVIFGENLETADVTSVSMGIAKNEVKYDFTAETKLTTQGSSATITMFNATDQEATTKKFWAIIPPQTTTAGETLFTITVASGQTYTYKPANGETFAGNAIRRIKLEIKNDIPEVEPVVFSVSSVNINGWGNIDSVIEEEFEVVEDVLVAELSIPNTITTTSYTNLSDSSPFSVSGVSVESVTENNENIIKLTSGTSTNWYGNTLFFYAGSANQIIVGQKYKISFEAKADEGSVALHAFAHKKTKDGNNTIIYAQDSESSSQNSLFSNNVTTGEYTTYSFTINTSKDFLVTGVGATATKYNGSTEDSNLVISFRPAYSTEGDTGTYYIKNIKIEQQ